MLSTREQPPFVSPDTQPTTTEAVFGIRRNDMKPEVRDYADNLRDQIRQIFKDHGVKTVDEFSAAARAKKISREKVREVQSLLQRLHSIVEHGEIPPEEEPRILQKWMQEVYNELGIKTEVPLPPLCTPEQRESFRQFGLRQFYIPEITEDQYPASFRKTPTETYVDHKPISRRPFHGGWVAIETIAGSKRDPYYSNDSLASALELDARTFHTWDDLRHDSYGVFPRIAKIMHTPKENLRFPSVEEWIFFENIFLWLREQKNENNLPDLRTVESEYTETPFGDGWSCMIKGSSHHIVQMGHDAKSSDNGFRILAELS